MGISTRQNIHKKVSFSGVFWGWCTYETPHVRRNLLEGLFLVLFAFLVVCLWLYLCCALGGDLWVVLLSHTYPKLSASSVREWNDMMVKVLPWWRMTSHNNQKHQLWVTGTMLAGMWSIYDGTLVNNLLTANCVSCMWYICTTATYYCACVYCVCACV